MKAKENVIAKQEEKEEESLSTVFCLSLGVCGSKSPFSGYHQRSLSNMIDRFSVEIDS